MPQVNFFLKKAEEVSGRSLVYLQFRYPSDMRFPDGRKKPIKIFYSARFNIEKNNWDKRRQLVKERSATLKDGKINCNDLLKNLRDVCLNAYYKELVNGIPSAEMLRKHLDDFMFKNVRGGKGEGEVKIPTLFELIQKFIDGHMGKQTLGTRKTYQTALMHLTNFQKAEKYPVDYDTIKLEFKNRYVTYLEKEKLKINKKGKKIKVDGLSKNSVAKEIKNIRTFMNMANEEGYTTNKAHLSKKFSVEKEVTDAVYLNDKELRKLYSFDFSDNKRLEAVRDLYIWSSYVGLRYSDAIRIGKENIVTIDRKQFIKITTQKTHQPVVIPCNDIVLKIFDKYKHTATHMPPSITGQKYNQYLKELAEVAGLTEKGRLASDLNKPLFECLSSHSARRNFATNCYLAGMDIRMIMAVTGHKTTAAFFSYLKNTQEENAKRMGEAMERGLSKSKLKIA